MLQLRPPELHPQEPEANRAETLLRKHVWRPAQGATRVKELLRCPECRCGSTLQAHDDVARFLEHAAPSFHLLAEGERVRDLFGDCLLYTSPSPRDVEESRMPSSA